jgi:hypothetical protein
LVADTKGGTVAAPRDLRAATEAITRVEVTLEEETEIWRRAHAKCSKTHQTSTNVHK